VGDDRDDDFEVDFSLHGESDDDATRHDERWIE
jgi:hypothetical protein